MYVHDRKVRRGKLQKQFAADRLRASDCLSVDFPGSCGQGLSLAFATLRWVAILTASRGWGERQAASATVHCDVRPGKTEQGGTGQVR